MALEGLDGKVAIVTGRRSRARSGRGAGAGRARAPASSSTTTGAPCTVSRRPSNADAGGRGDQGRRRRGGRQLRRRGRLERGAGARSSRPSTTYGGLDVLVNNAGFLRDRMLFNMSEEEWDAVIRVHLKGHFCMSRHAAGYWRERGKAERRPVYGRVVNTSSEAGLVRLRRPAQLRGGQGRHRPASRCPPPTRSAATA